MKLKRLLASGKTFGTIRGRSPYQMRRENQLPTFGNEARIPDERPEVSLQNEPSAEVPMAVGKKTASVETTGASLPGLWKRLKSWFFKFLPRRKRRQRGLVQAELLLDNVKVARNDLNDSDLELVPVPQGKKLAPQPAQFVRPPPRHGPSRIARKQELEEKP